MVELPDSTGLPFHLDGWYRRSFNYIFNHPILCRVRHIDNYTPFELKYKGIKTSGDRDIDNAMMNNMVTCMLTIDMMIDKEREDVLFTIVKEIDLKFIYESIVDYVKFWREYEVYTNYRADIPVKDLEDLLKFAQKVYPVANFYIKKDEEEKGKEVQSVLMRHGSQAAPYFTIPTEEVKPVTATAPHEQLMSEMAIADENNFERNRNNGTPLNVPSSYEARDVLSQIHGVTNTPNGLQSLRTPRR